MKIKFLFAALVSFLMAPHFLNAQETPVQRVYRTTEFKEMNNRLMKGWNTSYTKSMLCHVLLPESFAINLQLINRKSGDTLKSAVVGREDFGSKEHVMPGYRSYDGSYTELVVEWQGISVKVQSAAKNNRLYLMITPIKSLPGDSILINPEMLWGRKGEIVVKNNRILANTALRKIELAIISGHYKASAQNLKISLDKVTVISSEPLQTVAEIERVINATKTNLVAERTKYKKEANTYDAIHSVMAWNTVYDSMNNRIISPVSRNWATLGWVLFGWDNYFAAYLLSIDNKDLAYANALSLIHI